MESISFSTKQINNMNVHFLKTEKYKTNTIILNITTDLSEDTVTNVSLLPFILKRGNMKYQSLKILQHKLDDLFGTIFDTIVFKRGDRQIVQFSLEIANEKYLNTNMKLLEEAINLLGEIIKNPLIVNDGFNSDYLKLEKDLLTDRINSVLDDKIRYAEYKTIENMYKNEPYRLLIEGKLEDINNISAESLYEYYRIWQQNSPMDLFVVGNFDESELINNVQKSFNFSRQNILNLKQTSTDKPIDKENVVVEELDVNQGKLNFGIRTYTNITDDDYVSLLVYNGVLGGFPHSKLFVNVREKASLAYYASSKLDSHKGLMIIQSGIEVDKFTKASEIIKKQLELFKDGEVSDQEMELTKAVLSNQLKEMVDRPRQLIDFAFHSRLSGKNRTLPEVLNEIANTTKEDVIKIAQKAKVDTIYFLKDNKEDK